jgi:hypothetical protein
MDPSEEFKSWIAAIGGITKAGLEKLDKSAIVSLIAVRCLEPEDIVDLKLAVGDRVIFRAGWQTLVSKTTAEELGGCPLPPKIPSKPPPEDIDPEAKIYSVNDISKFLGQPQASALKAGQTLQEPDSSGGRVEALRAAAALHPSNSGRGATRHSEPVTAKELAKDRLLNRLAAEFAQDGVKDSLSLQDLAIAGIFKGEKALLPVNFVTIFTGCSVDDEEILGCGQFGSGKLVWQSGKNQSRRPTADKLTFGQYFEANARILNLLDLEPEVYVEYLDYLRQVGILLQTFTSSSVFTLDHLHRLYVHDTKSRWNIIENTLQNSVLKKKEDVARQNQFQNQQGGRRNDARSGRAPAASVSGGTGQKTIGPDAVCWLYNLPKGCFWGNKCIYPHVCSVDGCWQNHPACRHAEFVKGKQSA